MTPKLRREPALELTGQHRGLTGDVSGLRGDVSGLLTGDVSGLRGSATGIVGNLDDCGLTDAERAAGVDIETLIGKETRR